MLQNLAKMLALHKCNPKVLGLLEFGGDHGYDDYQVGDYDLFVILTIPVAGVSSLHFYINSIPVDLNFISLKEMQQVAEALAGLRQRVAGAPLPSLSENAGARICHRHRHVMDKLRGRLETEPDFCRFLPGTNIYWLLQNDFRLRQLPYKGERAAMAYWRREEPELWQMTAAFYATLDLERKVELIEALTERVIAPLAGLWQNDGVLAFGEEDSRNLQTQGQIVYKEFFGRAAPDRE